MTKTFYFDVDAVSDIDNAIRDYNNWDAPHDVSDIDNGIRDYNNAVGADPVTTGVNAAATIATTINNIVDQNKQLQYTQGLNFLNATQQIELAQKLQAAQTDAAKLQILNQSIFGYLATTSASSQTNTIILIVVAVVALIGVLFFVIKGKVTA